MCHHISPTMALLTALLCTLCLWTGEAQVLDVPATADVDHHDWDGRIPGSSDQSHYMIDLMQLFVRTTTNL